MLAVSAQPLPPTSPPQPVPMLPPAHVVDLLTADGMAAFGAQWKSMDVKIIEGPALPNAMPGYKTSYDISPHAGVTGFDDSSWPTLEPSSCWIMGGARSRSCGIAPISPCRPDRQLRYCQCQQRC
jgi:hypothetical protein